jgi:hypothetical protein
VKLIKPSALAHAPASMGRGARLVGLPYDEYNCRIRSECPKRGECLQKNGCVGRAFQLSCEHWTDTDVQLTYAVWRPKGKDYYCEHCSKWVKRQPPIKAPPLPDDPRELF